MVWRASTIEVTHDLEARSSLEDREQRVRSEDGAPQPGSWGQRRPPQCSLHTELSKRKPRVKDSFVLFRRQRKQVRKGRVGLSPDAFLFCWPLQVLIIFQGLASVFSPPKSLSKRQATMLSCPALLKPLTTSTLDVCMLLCLRVSFVPQLGPELFLYPVTSEINRWPVRVC